LVIGILPAASEEDPSKSPAGYPNPWVEIAIRTHLPWSGERGQSPMSRNHINVLTSDVMIILPGGPGTASEAMLAVKHGCPAIAYGLVQEPMPLPDGIASPNELRQVQDFVLRALAGRIEPRGSANV
jgi:predicted Rossmann-fold nucleotide-binding protein